MTEVIYIIVGGFIKLFPRLSTQRVNNQIFCCRDHIIELYYKSKTKKSVRFTYRTIYNNNKIVIHKGQSRKSVVLFLVDKNVLVSLSFFLHSSVNCLPVSACIIMRGGIILD